MPIYGNIDLKVRFRRNVNEPLSTYIIKNNWLINISIGTLWSNKHENGSWAFRLQKVRAQSTENNETTFHAETK